MRMNIIPIGSTFLLGVRFATTLWEGNLDLLQVTKALKTWVLFDPAFLLLEICQKKKIS